MRKAWPYREPSPSNEQQSSARGAAHGDRIDISGMSGKIPTSRVLDICLCEPFVAQYRLVSRACVQLVCGELGLLRVCAALHDVAMGAQGSTLLNMAVLVDKCAVDRRLLTSALLEDVQPHSGTSCSANPVTRCAPIPPCTQCFCASCTESFHKFRVRSLHFPAKMDVPARKRIFDLERDGGCLAGTISLHLGPARFPPTLSLPRPPGTLDRVFLSPGAAYFVACRFLLDPGRSVMLDQPATRVASSSARLESMSLQEWQLPDVDGPGTSAGSSTGFSGVADSAAAYNAGVVVEARNLHSADAIKFHCAVAVPLRAIITQASLDSYSDVFTVLLRMRWVSLRLARLLLDLRKAIQRQPGPQERHRTASQRMLRVILDFQVQHAPQTFNLDVLHDAACMRHVPGPRVVAVLASRPLAGRPLMQTQPHVCMACVQRMHHFVQCLESVIHSDVLVPEWRALEVDLDAESSDIDVPRDLRWLALRHGRFASACADGVALAFDQHLCNLVARLLQVAMSGACDVQSHLCSGAGASPLDCIAQAGAWAAVRGASKEVRERLDFVMTRLTHRASSPLLAHLATLVTTGGHA